MAPPLGYAPSRRGFQARASTRLASAANPGLIERLNAHPIGLWGRIPASVFGTHCRSRACAHRVRSASPEFPRAMGIVGGWMIESNSKPFRAPSGFKPAAGPARITILGSGTSGRDRTCVGDVQSVTGIPATHTCMNWRTDKELNPTFRLWRPVAPASINPWCTILESNQAGRETRSLQPRRGPSPSNGTKWRDAGYRSLLGRVTADEVHLHRAPLN